MDMTAFAQSVVRAADAGQLPLLPISKRDASNGCMVRFRVQWADKSKKAA